MPILLAEREQCDLRPGGNSLGGDAPDAVVLSELAMAPLAGRIMVPPDGPPTIQRLASSVPLSLDGVMLGASPRVLPDGATLQVGSVRMRYYETAASAEGAAPDVPRRQRESERATQVFSAIGAPALPAALVALDSGRMIRLPARDIVLGRSEDADVHLAGEGVSRRHAVIRPEDGGYTIADESTNGTFVNGARLTTRHVLKAGDTIAFGTEQFRFEPIDAALAARLAGGLPSAPLAELEIIRGRGRRTTFAIERAVCALGRGPHNDVTIEDDSVSPSHATLLLQGDTWYLTDLRSTNGTFVDGYRIAGERALTAGAVVKVGQVAMAFKPRAVRTSASVASGSGRLRSLARALFS